MEKVPMCRICLVDNVRMYVVVNRNLHELYEKLTNIPFVTEDSRPILACFFCCAKLKQCYQLLRQCQEAEELFAQRMKEDYEPNPLVNQEHLKFCNGFIKSPIVLTSIADEYQTEGIAIKDEFPAVCEGLDDVIEPKEERESDELEPGNFDEICQDVADIPPRHLERDLEDYDLVMEFKVEVEEEEVSNKKGRGENTENIVPGNLDEICQDVADIPPRYLEPDLEDFRIYEPLMEFKVEVEEEEVSNKKRKATDTERTPDANLEDVITAEQTKIGNSQGIRISQKHTSDRGNYLKEPNKYDKRNINEVKNIIHHTRKQIREKHKCDVCKHSFVSMSNLTKHIRCFHSEETPYKCIVCFQKFGTWSRLMLHICIKKGPIPYKCDVCQRTFNAEVHLLRHIRTHDKTHKCDICQRSFCGKGPLISHSRIHAVNKPYKCDVCERGFYYKGLLLKHMLIHTRESPYKCPVCQSSFSQRVEFTRHTCIQIDYNTY